jgi:hypothetical protein
MRVGNKGTRPQCMRSPGFGPREYISNKAEEESYVPPRNKKNMPTVLLASSCLAHTQHYAGGLQPTISSTFYFITIGSTSSFISRA